MPDSVVDACLDIIVEFSSDGGVSLRGTHIHDISEGLLWKRGCPQFVLDSGEFALTQRCCVQDMIDLDISLEASSSVAYCVSFHV